ncbi:MAG: 3'-5' exoribonuclease [Clostridiales bacterium]|nr:3'-5' exoribonuclease [Candidatus Apopatousia equi]
MEKIEQFILQKTQGKFEDLQFFDAQFEANSNTLITTFLTLNKEKYTEDKINELSLVILEFLENKCKVEIKIKKQQLSSDFYLLKIKEYLKNSPFYQSTFDIEKSFAEMKNDDNLLLTFTVDKLVFNDDLKAKFEEQISKIVLTYATMNIDFMYQHKSVDYSQVLSSRKEEIEEEISSSITQYCKIKGAKELLGKSSPIYSAILPNQVKATDKDIAVCGKLQGVYEVSGTKGEGENAREYKFYKFKLYEDEGSIEVVCFLKNGQDLLNIEKDTKLVVVGDVDTYNSNLSLKAKSISICTYEVPQKAVKQANKSYRVVKPTPYIATEQISFLDSTETIKSEYLKNNTFVVFDLETTGLNISTCNVIEIGAVKLVDGKIVEQFSTFVNPEEHIPEEATKTNNITDDMVKDAPTIEQVIPDFYKFTDGCILVAHNIGYDFPIISRLAKNYGYIMLNKQEDTLLISQKHLGQLKNHKLSTVCDFLGVSLVGAHRAVNDTVATAKVFIKLIENYEKK